MFVSVGPIDGFVHLKDMSWEHISNPKQLFKSGDKVKCKILEISPEAEKITLGIKQLTEDPWNLFVKEYKKGDIVKGEVTKLFDYGAFIKIFDGVEGLLHVSEMSWTKRVNHPKEILKQGDITETKILEIEEENKKLSLGLKQILKNPWDNISELLPKGEKVKGKIKNVLKSGAGMFIELKEGIEGFLPQSEIDWLNKNVNMKRDYKRGDEIEVVIIDINQKDRKITVGRKQLTENPYERYITNHPKGDSVSGKISKITTFGAFVKLEKNIEGLVPISHISRKRIEKVEEIVKVGDEVNCVILDYDLIANKITLSMKNYEKKQERKEIEKYTISSSEEDEKVTLGDLFDLKKKMNEQNEE
jgi:small subunit ribosomal protein S1